MLLRNIDSDVQRAEETLDNFLIYFRGDDHLSSVREGDKSAVKQGVSIRGK